MEKFLKDVFSFWDTLSSEEKKEFIKGIEIKKYGKGVVVHHGKDECIGIYVIKSGVVRVFMNSPNGGELTLYRLLDGEICIVSAGCMVNNLDFDTNLQFEKETELLVIPKILLKRLNDENIAVKEYFLEKISERFSNMMWLFNQYVFSNVAKRLGDMLFEYRSLEGDDTLNITHDILARDLGTAREVVTRLLKQFQLDGLVELSRGKIVIKNLLGLTKL